MPGDRRALQARFDAQGVDPQDGRLAVDLGLDAGQPGQLVEFGQPFLNRLLGFGWFGGRLDGSFRLRFGHRRGSGGRLDVARRCRLRSRSRTQPGECSWSVRIESTEIPDRILHARHACEHLTENGRRLPQEFLLGRVGVGGHAGARGGKRSGRDGRLLGGCRHGGRTNGVRGGFPQRRRRLADLRQGMGIRRTGWGSAELAGQGGCAAPIAASGDRCVHELLGRGLAIPGCAPIQVGATVGFGDGRRQHPCFGASGIDLDSGSRCGSIQFGEGLLQRGSAHQDGPKLSSGACGCPNFSCRKRPWVIKAAASVVLAAS